MTINHRRISLSIASGFLLEVINKISPILILHHAQKTMGLANFGWAQYEIAFFEAVQPFVTYGFANFALTESATKGHESHIFSPLFSHIFILKLLNAMIIAMLFLVTDGHLLSSGTTPHSFSILLLVLGANVMDAFWYCIAQYKLAAISLVSGILRVGSMLLILFLIRSGADKTLFVLLSLLPNVLIAVITGFYALHKFKFSPLNFKLIQDIIFKSTPFALIILCSILFDRLDIFLIERWFGIETAGIYAGPAKVVQSISLLTASIALPFYAEILKIQDRDSIYKHASISLWCLSAIISPIIFGTWFVEADLIQLLFPRLPKTISNVMSILNIGMIGSILVSVFGLQILMSKARPWVIVYGLVCSFFIFTTFAYLGKDILGFVSVAYGQVLGRLVLGLICLWFAREFLPRIPWQAFFKPLIAGLTMGATLKIIGFNRLFLNISMGGLIYILTLAIFNYSELKELLQHPKVKNILSRFS